MDEIFLTYILPYLVTIVVAFMSGFITFKIAAKQAKLDLIKQKEQFVLENNTHIRKIHYEEKFKIYRALSESFLSAILDNSLLFPNAIDHVPPTDSDREIFYLKRYENACKSIDKAMYTLYSNAPFIEKDAFDKFDDVLKLCRLQIVFYPDFVIKKNSPLIEMTKEKNACWIRTSEIDDKRKELMDYLREKITREEHLG